MKLYLVLLILFAVFCFADVSTAKKAGGETIVSDCINGYVKTRAEYQRDLVSWKTCEWQRSQIIDYMKKGFDVNNNGKLEFWECEKARHFYFNDEELKFGESCEKVFARCDCDNSGEIDLEDFENSYLFCLRDCRAAKRVWFFIGSRMPTGNAYEGLQAPDDNVDKSVLDE